MGGNKEHSEEGRLETGLDVIAEESELGMCREER